MPRKSAKQIVEDVVAKVNEELPTKKKAPKKEETQEAVKHNPRCMVIVVPGSACNCPVSVQR